MQIMHQLSIPVAFFLFLLLLQSIQAPDSVTNKVQRPRFTKADKTFECPRHYNAVQAGAIFGNIVDDAAGNQLKDPKNSNRENAWASLAKFVANLPRWRRREAILRYCKKRLDPEFRYDNCVSSLFDDPKGIGKLKKPGLVRGLFLQMYDQAAQMFKMLVKEKGQALGELLYAALEPKANLEAVYEILLGRPRVELLELLKAYPYEEQIKKKYGQKAFNLLRYQNESHVESTLRVHLMLKKEYSKDRDRSHIYGLLAERMRLIESRVGFDDAETEQVRLGVIRFLTLHLEDDMGDVLRTYDTDEFKKEFAGYFVRLGNRHFQLAYQQILDQIWKKEQAKCYSKTEEEYGIEMELGRLEEESAKMFKYKQLGMTLMAMQQQMPSHSHSADPSTSSSAPCPTKMQLPDQLNVVLQPQVAKELDRDGIKKLVHATIHYILPNFSQMDDMTRRAGFDDGSCWLKLIQLANDEFCDRFWSVVDDKIHVPNDLSSEDRIKNHLFIDWRDDEWPDRELVSQWYWEQNIKQQIDKLAKTLCPKVEKPKAKSVFVRKELGDEVETHPIGWRDKDFLKIFNDVLAESRKGKTHATKLSSTFSLPHDQILHAHETAAAAADPESIILTSGPIAAQSTTFIGRGENKEITKEAEERHQPQDANVRKSSQKNVTFASLPINKTSKTTEKVKPSGSGYSGWLPLIYRSVKSRKNKKENKNQTAAVEEEVPPEQSPPPPQHAQQIPASTGFPVFDEYEPTFKLDFPLRDYHAPLRDIFAPGSQEEASSHWSAHMHNMKGDGNGLFSAIAYSLEANDFYDFSRDPFSLFYERHSQLRRAAAQVLILLSRKADSEQKKELIKLIEQNNKKLADYDDSIEAYARKVTAIDNEWVGQAEIQALAVYLGRPIALIGKLEPKEEITVFLPDLRREIINHVTTTANGCQQLWTRYSNPVVFHHSGDHYQAVYCTKDKSLPASPSKSSKVVPELISIDEFDAITETKKRLKQLQQQKRKVTATELVEVEAEDGNSMFRAIALLLQSPKLTHRQLRQLATKVLIEMSRFPPAAAEKKQKLVQIIVGQLPFAFMITQADWDEKTDQTKKWEQKSQIISSQIAGGNQDELFRSSIEHYANEMTAVDGARAGDGELQALASLFDHHIVVISDRGTRIYGPSLASSQAAPLTDADEWVNLWTKNMFNEPPIVLYKNRDNHYLAVIGTDHPPSPSAVVQQHAGDHVVGRGSKHDQQILKSRSFSVPVSPKQSPPPPYTTSLGDPGLREHNNHSPPRQQKTVFDEEEPLFSLKFPLTFRVVPGRQEANHWSAHMHNVKGDGNCLFNAVALSLEANDFYDFSRDPFSLFYERHSQLRRAATLVLILLSRKADSEQKEELTNLIHANKDLADNDRSYGSIEAYAREVTAIDTKWVGPAEIQALAVYLGRPIALISAKKQQQQQSDGDDIQIEEEIVVFLPDLKRQIVYHVTTMDEGCQQLWTRYSNNPPVVVYHSSDHFQAVYCTNGSHVGSGGQTSKVLPEISEDEYKRIAATVDNSLQQQHRQQKIMVTAMKLVKVVAEDGNSMFRAIALLLQSPKLTHRQLRQLATKVLIEMSRFPPAAAEKKQKLVQIIVGQLHEQWVEDTLQWTEKIKEIANHFAGGNQEELFQSSIARYANEMTAVNGARAGDAELQALASLFRRHIVVISEHGTRIYDPELASFETEKIADPNFLGELIWNTKMFNEPIVLYKKGVNHYQPVIVTDDSPTSSSSSAAAAGAAAVVQQHAGDHVEERDATDEEHDQQIPKSRSISV